MNPGPEPVLDPLIIGKGKLRFRIVEDCFQFFSFIQKYNRILHAVMKLIECDKFEIDMKEGITVETNQQSGFAHMISRETRYAIPETTREFDHVFLVRSNFLMRDDHEIEVGEFIHCIIDP